MSPSRFEIFPSPARSQDLPDQQRLISLLNSTLKIPVSALPDLLAAYLPLCSWLYQLKRKASGPLLIGVSGGQGAGKTTLRLGLEILLRRHYGLRTCGFSLDDFYLSKTERRALAESIHPLFTTRGVPGTHDVEQGLRLIRKLRQADEGAVISIPSFDKAKDQPRIIDAWPTHKGKVDLILFDGWCLGATPQEEAALRDPINRLESLEDVHGTWRRAVNMRLRTDYARLFAEIDHLIFLAVPNFDKVREWRGLQERKLSMTSIQVPEQTSELMDEAGVERFVLHYERLTRHLLKNLKIADVVCHLDNAHKITRLSFRDPPQALRKSTDDANT